MSEKRFIKYLVKNLKMENFMLKNKFLNKIIQGDALEILKKIETNSIDLILTDPPYF